MKRPLAIVCGFMLWQQSLSAFAQQTPNNPMPVAAAGIVAQMEKEVAVAKKKAVESLEKVLRDTTKKGDLAGAMAVKQAIDRLNGEIAAVAQNKGGRGNPDIIGRWQGQGWAIEFFPDGTVAALDNSFRGTWVANGAVIEASFSNGVSHTMERTADGWAGVFKQGGKPNGAVTYKRMP